MKSEKHIFGLWGIKARDGHLLRFRPYNMSYGRLYIRYEKLFKNFEGTLWPHLACRAYTDSDLAKIIHGIAP